MIRRRCHPMTALVVWLGVAVLGLLFALVLVVAQLPTDAQLDRAHLAGMELGQQMCIGFKSEMERGPRPAAVPVQPQRGGLL